ncbi:MAG: arylsulfatase [Myxococcota bacterium]
MNANYKELVAFGPMLRLPLCIGLVCAVSSFAGVVHAEAPNALGEVSQRVAEKPRRDRPNIVLIVADDMGYSDLGSFGGEIATPNLDRLSEEGLRGTDFYVSPTCSPTRAMLMSGVDNHIAGLGNMAELTEENQQSEPGYEGYLNERVVSVATVLRDSGYHTYMAGKWHLGFERTQWPAARGFERDLAMLAGGTFTYWDPSVSWLPTLDPMKFTRNGELLDELPPDFYSTRAYTDSIIENIDEQRGDGNPFFAFVSYQAPHTPLGLPDGWLERYRGRYDLGYDELRAGRLKRMKEIGLIDDGVAVPDSSTAPWTTLPIEQRKQSARAMEIYAGIVENMDFHVGRLLDHLEETGVRDNTLVIFFSDNGAEGNDQVEYINARPLYSFFFNLFFDNAYTNLGRHLSWTEVGPGWAHASMVPFRGFKGSMAEGGIRSPLIVAGPGVTAGSETAELMHVMDVAPTLLQVAGATQPTSTGGRNVAAHQGRSWWPIISQDEITLRDADDWLGFELLGGRAIRQGDWKLLSLPEPKGDGLWQLFRLTDDPSEEIDLSAKFPEKKRELIKLWAEYERENGVVMSTQN